MDSIFAFWEKLIYLLRPSLAVSKQGGKYVGTACCDFPYIYYVWDQVIL